MVIINLDKREFTLNISTVTNRKIVSTKKENILANKNVENSFNTFLIDQFLFSKTNALFVIYAKITATIKEHI
jgi:hypothetical protein